MRAVTFRLTAEEWADFVVYLAKQELDKSGHFRKMRQSMLFIWLPLLLVVASVLLWAALSGSPFTALVGLIIVILAISSNLNLRTEKSILQTIRRQALETMPARIKNETCEVSLTPRGILEKDSCEERLTVWDAIEDVQVTDRFLLARDKNGNHLTVPIRAFGGEAAAQAFLLEMQNLRMRAAVGLGTTVTEPAASPVVQPVEPEQKQTAGWWRSS